MGASGGRVLVRIAAAVFSAVLVVAALPARGETPVGTGTATIGFDLAAVGVDGPLGDLDAQLGSLLLQAGNQELTKALVSLEGVRALGETLVSEQVEAVSGENKTGDLGRSVGTDVVSASVSAAKYVAKADATSAEAALDALDADLSVAPLGVRVALGEDGLRSVSTATGSVASVSLVVDGLSLGLADLLPAELLGQLPLGVILDLLGALKLSLPADLAAAVDALTALPDTLADTDATIDELDAAEAELLALVADDPAVIAAQAAVDAAEEDLAQAEADLLAAQAEVDRLEAEVAALEAQIAAIQAELLTLNPLDPTDLLRINELNAQLTTLQSQLATKQAELTAAQQDLAAAEQAVADAEAALAAAHADLKAAIEAAATSPEAQALVDLVEQLEAELARLVGLLTDLLADIPNLQELIDDLRNLLAGAPLLDLGALEVALVSESAANHAVASVQCTVPAASVLGRPVSAVSCAELTGVLGTLSDAIAGALSALGLSTPVTVDAGNVVTNAVPGAAKSTSSVSLDLLDLAVAAVDVGELVDKLVADLSAQLDALLADASIASTGSVSALQLPSELEALLADFSTEVSALPLSVIPDGLRTVGLDIDLASLNLGTFFQVAGTGGPGDGTVGGPGSGTPLDPTAGGTPGSVPGVGDGPGGELPRTGGGLVLAAVGLWFAVTGRLLVFTSRRPLAEAHRSVCGD